MSSTERPRMWGDRYGVDARRVLALAGKEAKELHHGHVGTEHLLLGVIGEGTSEGARLLRRLDVAPDVVRSRATEAENIEVVEPSLSENYLQVVDGALGSRALVDPLARPLTVEAKRALGSVLSSYHSVGPDHVLLGLLSVSGNAARILSDLEIATTAVREQIMTRLTGDR